MSKILFSWQELVLDEKRTSVLNRNLTINKIIKVFEFWKNYSTHKIRGKKIISGI
jgi:hypothetical protein